jgi:hypothetical protein
MKTTAHSLYTILFCWIAGSTFTVAFVIPCIQNSKFSLNQSAAPSHPTKLQVLWDPRNAENDSGLVDFPTPSQRAEIKKEAKRRQARRDMPSFSFSAEESDGPWSDETVQAIWKQLTETEMMELKGICREDRREVFQTGKSFCEELEELIAPSGSDEVEEGDREDQEDGGVHLPVALISTKGHSALIYCPTLPTDHPDKFILRTSVGQKNVWKSRPKPLRDISGQIVKDSMPE